MPFHDKIIPKEISDFTREVEDFVRPVTDPVRSFIAKAVPREIKPVLPFIASSMVPLPFMNFPGGQFLGGFGLDALTQKLMTDPEDEDTDIDYLSALMSGVARSTASAARTMKSAILITSQYFLWISWSCVHSRHSPRPALSPVPSLNLGINI